MILVSSQDSPTRMCHAPTLAETPSGLVTAWFGDRKMIPPACGIWLMRLVAGCWSAPVEIVAGTSHDERRISCWNPVLFRPEGGPLLLFYKVGRSVTLWQGWLTMSDDDGQTWTTPWPLGSGPEGVLIGPSKNKPLALTDGTLVCPSSTEYDNVWRVHMYYSRDLRHWQRSASIEDPLGLGAIQPCLFLLSDGTILALCRTRRGIIARSLSDDGGQTWSALEATTLPNPNSGIDGITLHDGRLLLAYNDSSKHRTPLVLAVSQDQGAYWRKVHTLTKQPQACTYPAIIQSANGLVHIAYSVSQQGIDYAAIDLQECSTVQCSDRSTNHNGF